MPTQYKFPDGKWSIEAYHAAIGESFTGSFDLQVTGNPTHSKAILIHCDDAEFIAELLAFLNRNN